MKMLTKEIKTRMPPLMTTEDIPLGDKIVQAKYFTPDSNWTWYAIEACAVTESGEEIPLAEMDARGDIVDVLFFGLVEGLEREWGYFNLNELMSARGPWGLKIERDIYQTPKPLREVRPDLFGAPDHVS